MLVTRLRQSILVDASLIKQGSARQTSSEPLEGVKLDQFNFGLFSAHAGTESLTLRTPMVA